MFFFFNDTATTEIYTLSLHDALPISFENANGENPFAVQSALQTVMQRNAGIIRDKSGLETALAELENLKGRARKSGITGSREYNPGWHTAIDLRSLLIVSEATARAALERTESRGAHT